MTRRKARSGWLDFISSSAVSQISPTSQGSRTIGIAGPSCVRVYSSRSLIMESILEAPRWIRATARNSWLPASFAAVAR